jgi:hypothetical protein
MDFEQLTKEEARDAAIDCLDGRGIVIVGGSPRHSTVQGLKKDLGVNVKWLDGGNEKAAKKAMKMVAKGEWVGIGITTIMSHAGSWVFTDAARIGLPVEQIYKYGKDSIIRGVLEATKKEDCLPESLGEFMELYGI